MFHEFYLRRVKNLSKIKGGNINYKRLTKKHFKLSRNAILSIFDDPLIKTKKMFSNFSKPLL